MRIITKQSYNWMEAKRKEATYQNEFPLEVKCFKCKEKASLMMLIDDDEGLVMAQRQSVQRGIWPHDCMAIALYFCQSCGEITACWNQG